MNIFDTFPNNRPLNFLRLGIHGERKYFEKCSALFAGIVSNGTTVALTPEATGTFLVYSMIPRKPFFIDPLTYAFERSPIYITREEGGIKRSVKNLVGFFGKPLSRIVGARALSPHDFKERKIKEEFCRKVISFQKDIVPHAVSENMKYFEKIGVDIGEIPKPMIVIPPYLYLDIDSWESWTDLNIDFIKIALDLEREIPVFGEIVLSRTLLYQPEILKKLCEKYNPLECAGFLIWISDFPEYKTTIEEIVPLRGFIRTIANLGRASRRPVINLYGGYLSALLFSDGLTGFCHGPGYGEDRNIVPIGGGLPYPKYYFTPLHRRIHAERVEWFIKETRISWRDFCLKVCDCPICNEVLKNSMENFSKFGEKSYALRADGLPISYATERAKELNNFHYLHARHKEILNVQSLSKDELLSTLGKAEKDYLRYFGTEWAAHLGVWYEALSRQV